MEMPSQVTPALWGAVAGAVGLAIVGFSWGGWVTAATAELSAKQRASTAVVSALAPICLDKFQLQTNATQLRAELKAVSSWEQGAFVEKRGWATMPGSTTPDASVAKACADLIGKLKL